MVETKKTQDKSFGELPNSNEIKAESQTIEQKMHGDKLGVGSDQKSLHHDEKEPRKIHGDKLEK
jgi:hypothetical protein